LKEQLYSAGGFIIFLVMCLGAQLTGSFLTMPAIRSGWYLALEKPFFNPPAWLFGPVWTVLYFIMALSAWMVWRQESEDPLVRPALYLFFVQLLFNVIWPALFFSIRRPGWAMVEISLLWLLILATILIFHKVNKWAAWLLAPYLAWVLYAVILNSAIWWLNRGGSGGSVAG